VELAWVSIAQIAEKIHFPLAVRKECRIQFVSVETGHRPAVQSQSACGQDEVRGLQRAVAEGILLNEQFISDEVGASCEMGVLIAAKLEDSDSWRILVTLLLLRCVQRERRASRLNGPAPN
jgi:hypothetical protein